jgi:hypothetical protein
MSVKKIPTIIEEDTYIANWKAWTKMSEQSINMLKETEQIKELIWLIEDDDLRAFTYFIFSQSHPDFWVIPSSSSGKYHPVYENGEKGLLQHIRVTLALSFMAMRRYGYDAEFGKDINEIAEMRDLLVFSVLIHDWAKNGHPIKDWGKYTKKNHAEECAKYIEEEFLPNFIKFFPEIKDTNKLQENMKLCANAIRYHYGVWSTKRIHPNDKILSDLDRMLAESDYYSSRKIFIAIDEEEIKKIYAENSPAYIKRS